MFVDLVQSLRCLNTHEDGWLVAVTRRMEGRSIVHGTLGCPVCRREYPVVDGVGYFGVEPPAERGRAAPTPSLPGESDALRLAAFLGLETPGGIVVLGGPWARLALELRAIVPVSCVLLDPPPGDAARVGEGLGALRTTGTIPLAAGSVRGVALDPADGEARLREALRVLAGRGRLVAPARLPVPPDADELARDGTIWVARTRLAASAPVGIARGARPDR